MEDDLAWPDHFFIFSNVKSIAFVSGWMGTWKAFICHLHRGFLKDYENPVIATSFQREYREQQLPIPTSY